MFNKHLLFKCSIHKNLFIYKHSYTPYVLLASTVSVNRYSMELHLVNKYLSHSVNKYDHVPVEQFKYSISPDSVHKNNNSQHRHSTHNTQNITFFRLLNNGFHLLSYFAKIMHLLKTFRPNFLLFGPIFKNLR